MSDPRSATARLLGDTFTEAKTLTHKGNQLPNRHTGVSEIVVYVGIITLPLVFASGVLLFLVLVKRVPHTQPISPELGGIGQDLSDAFYVSVNSTSLVLLASLSSTFATILIGCVMTLVAYPVARNMSVGPVPTIYQLGLVIAMVQSGNWASIWRLLEYKTTIKRGPRVSALCLSAYVLVFIHALVYTPF
jgi:hypothetical protein